MPPAPEPNYKPQGKYIELNGLKTYVSGPEDADKAILVLYDIFGFKNQILQGADLLAWGDKNSPKQVFMPDMFQESGPADIAWYPPVSFELADDFDGLVFHYRAFVILIDIYMCRTDQGHPHRARSRTTC